MSNMVSKRFSIEIIPYTFAKAGEEADGRLLPLCLVMEPEVIAGQCWQLGRKA